MRTRLILAGLGACIVLPGILASGANADHNRHWFFDSYNQYDGGAFNSYVPERRRVPGAVYGYPEYEEEYLTERQYRKRLRAERRKARQLRAKRRKAEIRKRWRKREVRYDLAPETFKRKQSTNVPLPRARPFAEPVIAAQSIDPPVEPKLTETKPVVTATLGNSPVTIETTPAPARSATPKAVEVEPIAPIEAKPVEAKPLQTATIDPAPAKPEPPKVKPAKKVTAKKVKTETAPEKTVKGRISCKSAEKIVAGFGFTGIEAKSCNGKSYDFAAQRDGKPFTITLSSASGELTEVKRN